MKTLTAEQIAGIRKRIEFIGDDVCTIDAPDLDKLLTLAESLIPSEKLEYQFWTAEPWHLKDFVGTHEIAPSSINPDADPIAILSIQDYARSIACVNAFAGVPDPAAFMSAVDALVEACERQIEAFKTTMKMIGEEWEPENLKSDSFISVLPKTIKAIRSERGKH